MQVIKIINSFQIRPRVYCLIYKLVYKCTMHGKSPSITTTPTQYKLKKIDLFSYRNRVNSSNITAMTL